MQKFPVYTFWLFVVALWVAYTLPWVVNPGTVLTLGGYDLAEWLSLHPGARSKSPILFTSLLLRLPLVGMTGLIAFSTQRPLLTTVWMLKLGIVLLLIVAQMPPLEFFSNTHDVNYQQQMALAVVSLVLGGLGLSGLLAHWGLRVALLLALLSAGCGVRGIMNAISLMNVFKLPATLGLGCVAFSVLCLVWCIYGVGIEINRATLRAALPIPSKL